MMLEPPRGFEPLQSAFVGRRTLQLCYEGNWSGLRGTISPVQLGKLAPIRLG